MHTTNQAGRKEEEKVQHTGGGACEYIRSITQVLRWGTQVFLEGRGKRHEKAGRGVTERAPASVLPGHQQCEPATPQHIESAMLQYSALTSVNLT